MSEKVTPKALQVVLPPVAEMPAPEGANYFYFTASGPDVQMLVGYVDLRNIAAATEGDGIVAPTIYHRFVLSQVGFAHLRSQLAEIVAKHELFAPKASDANTAS